MYLLPEGRQRIELDLPCANRYLRGLRRLLRCVQTDLKYINAYSSVSHCGLVLFALCMMTETASTGAVLQMLSHGLMTALFFALIGFIYGRTHTRDVRELAGLMRICLSWPSATLSPVWPISVYPVFRVSSPR